MSGTSKAVLALCVLLLAALVAYYGMAPQPPVDLPPVPSAAKPVEAVPMFGPNLERSMERLGIPPAAVAISEAEPTVFDAFVMEPEGSSPTEAGETEAAESELPPVGAPAVPTAPAALATWTIRSGDTLSEIAAEVLGSSSMVQAIIDLNPGVDPMRLKVGAELQLPPREAAVAGEAVVEPDFPDDVVTHVVQEGETLSEIAKAYFGSSAKWKLIWNANRDRMAGPDRISVGTTLLIPLAD